MAPIYFDDIQEGATYVTARRTVTEADIVNFAGISGDFNPLHTDEIFAREETPFGRRIAHGLLVLAIGDGLRSELDDLHVLAFLELQRRFAGPVFPGDTIHVEYTVASKRRSTSDPSRGIVVLEQRVINQAGDVVQSGTNTLMVGTPPQEQS